MLPLREQGQAPKDVPKVNAEAVNVTAQTEKQVAVWDAANIWQKIWLGFAAVAVDVVEAIITACLGLLSLIGEGFGKAMIGAEEKSSAAFGRIAATVVKDVLDVDVSPDVFSRRGAAGGRKGAHDDLAGAIFNGFLRAAGTGPGGELKPDDAPAKRLVEKMTRVAIEDWLEGSLSEIITVGQVEAWGQLGDNIVGMLGLNRIVRRVMAPLVDATIFTPHEWSVNKQYRPRLLSPAQAVKAYRAGIFTEAQFREELARQGWSEQRMNVLLLEEDRQISVSDLDQLIAGGAWTESQAAEYLVARGWRRDDAESLLALAADRRIDTYRRQMATAASSAFVERTIDEVQFRRILETTGLDDREQHAIRQVAGLRRELRVKSLSTSEVEQAIKRGLLTLQDYRRHLIDEGYRLEDIQTLELLLLDEVKDREAAERARREREAERAQEKAAKAAAAEARRKQIEEQLAVKEISLAQMESLVRRGIRTLEEYSAFLAAERYNQADQVALTELLAQSIEERRAAAEQREEAARRAAVKKISLADVEASVKRKISSIEDYEAHLAELGFDERSRALMGALLRAEIDEAAANEAAREAARAKAAERDLPLGDLERAVRRGILSLEQFGALIDGRGFDRNEQDVLIALLESDLAADDEARRRRAEAEARAKVQRISLSDLEAAVRRGIRPMADYTRTLEQLGFPAGDRETLARLLQLAIDADKDAARRRLEAQERAAKRGVSISDVEAAVRAGVVPLSEYRPFIERLGFDSGSARILELTLAAEYAELQRARSKRAELEAAAKARSVSLSDFESSVKRKLRTMPEYRAFLAREQFAPDAIELLVRLLEAEIAGAEAAEAAKKAVVR